MNAYSPIIKQQRIFLTFIPLKKLEGWRKFKEFFDWVGLLKGEFCFASEGSVTNLNNTFVVGKCNGVKGFTCIMWKGCKDLYLIKIGDR